MTRRAARHAFAGEAAPRRVLLLMAARSYRAKAFMQAARRLGVDVVVGSNYRLPFASRTRVTQLDLDFTHPRRSARKIVDLAEAEPFDAIVNVDDDTTIVTAVAATELGLAYNSVEAARTTRDKYLARRALKKAGLPVPWFRRVSIEDDPARLAARVPYPCVLKPISQSASRGVIRANDREEFVVAFERIAVMLREDGKGLHQLLIESFLPGPEVALEGLLDRGVLRVLAIFDKPDPLDGPFFEETIYVTPSRQPPEVQQAIVGTIERAAAAFGLRHGPIHAELRLGPGGPYVLEVAARSIGGLCSNALRFGVDMSLEELILRQAVGLDVPTYEREGASAGAMMLPIPRRGLLKRVVGQEEALAVPLIEGLEITIPLGQPVVPLPEGDRYLGFLFARGDDPAAVEAALHEAHSRLSFQIVAPDELEADVPCLPASPQAFLLPMAPPGVPARPARARRQGSAPA
ncbi:MAG: ATP-grasp domain-containing protein [Chloroflexi bacterium]|nr:ATP-grasp domain-containing protein [Chloroflexota bacterium]